MNTKSEYKKIVVSTHDYLSPLRGGGGRRTLCAAFAFRQKGHEVSLVGPAGKKIKGIKTYNVAAPGKRYSQIASSLKFNFKLLLVFLRLARKADIFFVHNAVAAATIPLLKFFYNFTFFLDVSDLHTEYLRTEKINIWQRLLLPYLLKYEYYLVRSADFLIVVTREMKNFLISKGAAPGKIKIIYEGVDYKNISCSKQEGADSAVIHLGAIDKQHGVDLIISAISKVREKFPDVKFIFAGGGREEVSMKKLAIELGVCGNCMFTGWLTESRARQYLKQAAIGLIPRRNFLANRLITTIKIYDYWASATAVISSDLEGIKEISKNRENILFFENGNEENLARKIIFLLRNKKVKQGLAAKGLRTVKNFGLGELSFQMADFILNANN